MHTTRRTARRWLQTPQLMSTTFVHDPLGRVVQRLTANGAVTTQSYDPRGTCRGSSTAACWGRPVVSRLTYTYDPSNIRKSEVHSDGTVTTWSYDSSYRLTRENRSGGPTNTSLSITHSYDPAGNRTLQNDGTTVTTFSYSPANRLTLANSGAGGVTTYTLRRLGEPHVGAVAGGGGERLLHVGRVQPPAGRRGVGGSGDLHLQRRRPAGGEREQPTARGRPTCTTHKRLLHETERSRRGHHQYLRGGDQRGVR